MRNIFETENLRSLVTNSARFGLIFDSRLGVFLGRPNMRSRLNDFLLDSINRLALNIN